MLAASVAADAGLPGVNTLASGLAGSPDPIAVLTWDAPADGSAVHCKLSNDDVICLTEDQFRARCKVIGTLGQGSFAEVFKVRAGSCPPAPTRMPLGGSLRPRAEERSTVAEMHCRFFLTGGRRPSSSYCRWTTMAMRTPRRCRTGWSCSSARPAP